MIFDAARAKRVDLIQLPSSIEGTNCGNCEYYDKGFCNNSKVKMNVNKRMCCYYWSRSDAPLAEESMLNKKTRLQAASELRNRLGRKLGISRLSDCGHDKGGDFSKGNTCASSGGSGKTGVHFKHGTNNYSLKESQVANKPFDGSKLYVGFFGGEPRLGVFAEHRDTINGRIEDFRTDYMKQKYIDIRDLNFERIDKFEDDVIKSKKEKAKSGKTDEIKSKVKDILKKENDWISWKNVAREYEDNPSKNFDNRRGKGKEIFDILESMVEKGEVELKASFPGNEHYRSKFSKQGGDCGHTKDGLFSEGNTCGRLRGNGNNDSAATNSKSSGDSKSKDHRRQPGESGKDWLSRLQGNLEADENFGTEHHAKPEKAKEPKKEVRHRESSMHIDAAKEYAEKIYNGFKDIQYSDIDKAVDKLSGMNQKDLETIFTDLKIPTVGGSRKQMLNDLKKSIDRRKTTHARVSSI